MKRSLLAAVALVSISTAASAFELTCAAPRVAVGDDSGDNNPVVKVEVKYSNADHAWRIFHHLRNGLVISRSEQYAIQDASNERKTEWQGSLSRARHLYMVGEVKRTDDGAGIVYLEWLYDRKKGGQLVMQAAARCTKAAPTTTAEAGMVFSIPLDVPAGHMNIRTGPGSNYGLIGAIPAGQTVRASRCAPRDDGIRGADWCLVSWNGMTGWVSQVGLMPLQEQSAPPIPRPSAQAPWPSPSPSDAMATAPLQPKPVTPVPVRVKDSVPIYPHAQGNAAKIDVLIGGQALRMLLDTGATTCLITEGIAARLVNDGHAIWQENSRFKMADGTVRNMPMVLIHELRIGRHTVRNVPSGVSATDGIILAFPVVNGIAPFTIDTRVGELIFHIGSGKGDQL